MYETRYINTDLYLTARFDLLPILNCLLEMDFKGQVHLIGGGLYCLNCSGRSGASADINIRHILQALRSFDDCALGLLERCETREVNLGYDCGCRPSSFLDVISLDSLTGLQNFGLAVCITLYGSGEESTKRMKD
jgi:hypothetical protein